MAEIAKLTEQIVYTIINKKPIKPLPKEVVIDSHELNSILDKVISKSIAKYNVTDIVGIVFALASGILSIYPEVVKFRTVLLVAFIIIALCAIFIPRILKKRASFTKSVVTEIDVQISNFIHYNQSTEEVKEEVEKELKKAKSDLKDANKLFKDKTANR